MPFYQLLPNVRAGFSEVTTASACAALNIVIAAPIWVSSQLLLVAATLHAWTSAIAVCAFSTFCHVITPFCLPPGTGKTIGYPHVFPDYQNISCLMVTVCTEIWTLPLKKQQYPGHNIFLKRPLPLIGHCRESCRCWHCSQTVSNSGKENMYFMEGSLLRL